MRVLFITQRLPARSARGDQCRAFAHIRELSAQHAITVLSLSPATAAEHAALQPYCEDIIALRRPRWRAALRVLAALPGSQPLQVALQAGVGREVDLRALRQRGFDLVHLQLVRLAPLLHDFRPLPSVLDFVDSLALNMSRRARYDRAPVRWLAALEARRLQALEYAVCEQSRTAVCSPADRAAIRSDGHAPALVRNGVDLDEFAFTSGQLRAEEIVFVGNLGYFPNVDAACWFAADVLPALLRVRPQLRLRLVGARPAAALRRLAAAHANVELVGPVDRVQPYLARATAAIAPLRAGSGQQFKLLEAMALGTPVVSSRQAAQAIGAIDGTHLLAADDAAAMTAALLHLFDQPALAQTLALQARHFVEAEYSWARSAQELEALWQAAAEA
jgi:sugar transferase (PEP-CTERM/EpsH1 system associated)